MHVECHYLSNDLIDDNAMHCSLWDKERGECEWTKALANINTNSTHSKYTL